MRTLVLVDGEHYPPVTRWGIRTASDRGHEVVGALLVGGTESTSSLSKWVDVGSQDVTVKLPIQNALQNNIEMHFYTSGHMVYAHEPDLKALHAKIGQQALEIDFLAGALGRGGDASAKR